MSDNVHNLDALDALDLASRVYLVIIAFAKKEDFTRSWEVVKQRCTLLNMIIVRVEPTEANAIDLQINKHPTYTLYRSGNEDWAIVGNQDFIHKIHSLKT